MKKTTKRTWYKKPKTEYLCEYIFVGQDGKPINFVAEETVKGPTEETKRLIRVLQENGFTYIHDKSFINVIPGIKTKEEQFKDYALEEFRKAIFYECGAQQYL